MSTVRCPECGGSGKRAGRYGDIECFDCSGEGSWEDEPTERPKLSDDHLKAYREWCEQLTEVFGDPLKKDAA